ncbi:site-specific integrase [Brachybacterium sp. UMB0905]|uniref:tyrosine-type recombinase/integrase n=1 Tax=Brachybacterium sp. UMB0905 TaxID=2069310 RepID=UPI000C806D3A|nr:site-specific integrase [Brachybacterium sp. UMB0905]PMC75531.1 site-specific integrase [Brachybacterium sp. UMB0905]
MDDSVILGPYAEAWLESLKIAPRTRYNYRSSYTRWIKPTFAASPMTSVTTAQVRRWLATFPDSKPQARAQAYRVLSSMFRQAVEDGVVNQNPVRVKGAGEVRPGREGHALTVEEVVMIAERMNPDRRLAVLLAGFCALRPGETLALRRRDVDTQARTLHIRESASAPYGSGEAVGPVKTKASNRVVHYPAALDPDVARQLTEWAAPGSRGHPFPRAADPSKPLPYSTFSHSFQEAAARAGVEDVRPHDLRHTGATLAAGTGATVRELMARLGHTTPKVAMRYQHAARERDRSIADALGVEIAMARPQTATAERIDDE